jgi:tetratricopeptide (TPR) repeat protein
MSAGAISDAEEAPSDVQELHPWDPHKAAKDVEVGDYYFKRKNYKASIERYKHALIYKQDDAIATYRLAESLDKTGNSADALTYYRGYLKILPHGPYAGDAQKAISRLSPESRANAAN